MHFRTGIKRLRRFFSDLWLAC